MSVGWSVRWSVGRLVGPWKKSKNQNVLIIFDYLINFGASWREGSIGGGLGKGVREVWGEGKINN